MVHCKLVHFLYLLCNFGRMWCFSISSFSLGIMCNFQDRFDNGCFERVKSSRDQLECVVVCGWKETCLGVLIDMDSTECYHERTCSGSIKCISPNITLRYYRKVSKVIDNIRSTPAQITEQKMTTTSTSPTTLQEPTTSAPTNTSLPICQNSGTLTTSQTCNCSQTGGWVGDFCDRRPYNCSELIKFGYTTGTDSFPIDVYHNNSLLVNTSCNVGSSTSEVGILKHTGNFNMNRSWDTYVNGFFYNANNYFLGLENMLIYNRQGLTKIGIVLTFASPSVKGSISLEYYSFKISGNSSGYAYTVGSAASTSRGVIGSNTQEFDLSDPFKPCQNTPFSTYDNDQDMEALKNCASLVGAGWWFKECNPDPVVSPLGSSHNSSREGRVILPKYDTMLQRPREAFKHVYMYLKPDM